MLAAHILNLPNSSWMATADMCNSKSLGWSEARSNSVSLLKYLTQRRPEAAMDAWAFTASNGSIRELLSLHLLMADIGNSTVEVWC